MKRTDRIAWPVLLAVILLAAVSAGIPVEAQARKAVAVEGATFETAHSIRDNLKVYSGKEVVIHLRSGKTFQGSVKALGEHLVHLEKLSGRDFYDALIRIEDITAIEARFRELK
ncbi:MAG TPA: hypothetical protein PLO63_06265 [Syntrophales bacterium]|nr:hypothetical protein [Syntrophales bacterium]